MALDSAAVDVARTGAVQYSPTGTAAPTDADTTLAGAWRDVGYIAAGGVAEVRDRSTNKIVAWQNSDVVASVTTEASISVTFTMIETNENSVELFYGAAVVDGAVDIVPAETGGRRSIAVDYIDGTKYVRLYLPSAEVAEVGPVTLTSGDVVGYEVTIVGYPVVVGAVTISGRKFFTELVGS